VADSPAEPGLEERVLTGKVRHDPAALPPLVVQKPVEVDVVVTRPATAYSAKEA
jgi:hypothetical protein